MFFKSKIFAFAIFFSAISSAQEPCAPTTVIKSGLFERASGYYSCTVKKHNNNVVTVWTWSDDSAWLSSNRHKAKYAFSCSTRMMKLLERDIYGKEETEWSKPAPGTVGDKWMIAICSSARFF
jgi:hypothetical protein